MPDQIEQVAVDLAAFIALYSQPESDFAAFACVDESEQSRSEIDFEAYLWTVLRELHARDTDPWDPKYSRNPEDPTFKFSYAGRAMFIIGLHGTASRRARRTLENVVVFNPVWQFEHLRDRKQLDGLSSRIRTRDIAWDGSINPNLRFEGVATDALQYSGRGVDEQWTCPFPSP